MTSQTAVIGFPIHHSISPEIHNFWIKENKLNTKKYQKIAVEPNKLKDFILTCKRSNFKGLNITIPHKQAAFDLCDRVSPEALSLKAVNTIAFQNNEVHGYNTDTSGFQNSINTKIINSHVLNQRALVLGAGGAARAVIYQLKQMGAKVVVANRTLEKVEKIQLDTGLDFIICSLVDVPKSLKKAKYIVNTTNLGMDDTLNRLVDFKNANSDAFVYDLIYNPAKPDFLDQAVRYNLKIQNGLHMLISQAAGSFKIWHGIQPTISDELIKSIGLK